MCPECFLLCLKTGIHCLTWNLHYNLTSICYEMISDANKKQFRPFHLNIWSSEGLPFELLITLGGMAQSKHSFFNRLPGCKGYYTRKQNLYRYLVTFYYTDTNRMGNGARFKFLNSEEELRKLLSVVTTITTARIPAGILS